MRELIADPERRRRMGLAAQRQVEKLSASRILPRFEDAYRTVIAKAGSARGGSPGFRT
jgi:hypothetical protein